MEANQPLDVYSQIVSGVAARLTPKVASLRVPRQGSRGGTGESLGSGVVFTGDGFLLTNAHVVGKASGGTAAFSDGTSAPFRVVGADPLSDLAVLRANGATPARPSSARRTSSSSASWWWRSATRSAWPARSRPAWSARSAGHCLPAGASSRTSSRPTPRSTRATPAGRWPTRTRAWSASTPRWPEWAWAWPSR